MKFKFGYILMAGMVLTGCSGDDIRDGILCPAVVKPGIEVFVFDAETRGAISCGSVVTIEDGDFSETIVDVNRFDGSGNCDDEGPLQGAFEREGSYTVTVSKEGYEDYVDSSVEVESDVCGVITVEIGVYLTPE